MNEPKNLNSNDSENTEKALEKLKLAVQGKYPEEDSETKKLTKEQRLVLSELLLQQMALNQ